MRINIANGFRLLKVVMLSPALHQLQEILRLADGANDMTYE